MRLLETFLPCSPPNHASVRNRVHRVSVRVRHVEQALAGIYALQPEHKAGVDLVGIDIERLRHLL